MHAESASGVLNLKALRAGRHSRTPSAASRLTTRPSAAVLAHEAVTASQLQLSNLSNLSNLSPTNSISQLPL